MEASLFGQELQESLTAVQSQAARRTRCRRVRLRVHTEVEHGKVFMYSISALILLNVAFAALMTDDDKDGVPDDPDFAVFYTFFEAFSTFVFTAEYLLRLWACVDTPGGVVSFWPAWMIGDCQPKREDSCSAKTLARLKWVTNPSAIFDLAVALAFWVDIVLTYWQTEQAKGVGSTLRMFRIFQFAITILRLETHSTAFRQVTAVLKKSGSELFLVFFLACVLVMLGAVLIYFVEFQLRDRTSPDSDPTEPPECGEEMMSRFKSLTSCIYWSAMTVTTVGYGDMHPCTTTGQMLVRPFSRARPPWPLAQEP